MNLILEAHGLERTYHRNGAGVTALAGVDVAIEQGEFVAVMGPSGCGKSTLMHCLAGLDRPTGGEVWLEGRRVDTLSEAAWAVLRRRHIGVVFQFFNLLGNLSVADNVELPCLVAGMGGREARRRRALLLADLGIADMATAVPSTMSGGQQQRAAIARALINEPALLLADEPTGNLDSTTAAEVLAVLRSRHEAGQTILLVTHDARVAAAADRIITMRDGQVINETRLAAGDRNPALLSRMFQLEA